MGYSQEVKNELISLPVKRKCCLRMMTAGVLAAAVPCGDGALRIRFPNAESAEAVLLFLKAPVKKGFRTESFKVGKNSFTDLFLTSSEAMESYRTLIEDPDNAVRAECPMCHSHFFRGAFLACGSVTSPETDSHMEFRLPVKAAELLAARLRDEGFTPGQVQRKDLCGIYFKSNGQIQDLLGFMGASRAEFDHINQKIVRSLVKEDHQITNYEIGNMQKAVRAAHKSILAIRRLEANGMFASLPDNIKYTARLRLNHPDATLRELARLHNPGISISGLSHRLKYIEKLAEI